MKYGLRLHINSAPMNCKYLGRYCVLQQLRTRELFCQRPSRMQHDISVQQILIEHVSTFGKNYF